MDWEKAVPAEGALDQDAPSQLGCDSKCVSEPSWTSVTRLNPIQWPTQRSMSQMNGGCFKSLKFWVVCSTTKANWETRELITT